jgi:hypothetical protein
MKLMIVQLIAMICITVVFSTTAQIELQVSKDILTDHYTGNGVQWSAYETINISEEDWQTTFKRLDFMKTSFVRLMIPADNYCMTYPAGGAPKFDFNSVKMQRNYRILDYCQSKGIKVILGDWGDPVGKNKIIDPSRQKLSFDGIQEFDPRWTKIIGQLLTKLIKEQKYSCIQYYNLGNEPNGYWMNCESFDTWKQSIVNLDNELRLRKLRSAIKIVGPDAAWGNNWIAKIIEDKSLQKIIDTYEVHWYASKDEIEKGIFQDTMSYWRKYISKNDPKGLSKQFFMGEAGMVHGKNDKDQQTLIGTFKYGVWMADFIVQSMNAGQTGLIAWDLDDAMHTAGRHGDGYTINDYDWKVWGMWDSFGKEKGHPEWENLRPWYYTWSLFSRYIPYGSQVLKTSPTGIPGLRFTAVKIPGKGSDNFSIAIVNEAEKTEKIALSLPLVKDKKVFRKYDYFEKQRPVDKSGFPIETEKINYPISGKPITLTVPPNGVIFLTSL